MSKNLDVAFVANTDIVEKEGTHWCLFFLPNDLFEAPYLFDSFGRMPTAMGRPYWKNYMDEVTRRRVEELESPVTDWAYNHVPVQSPYTSVCGQLCAMTLFRLSRDLGVYKSVVPLGDIVKFMTSFSNKKK
jgi:hypothetical protein